jgi:signal transduction histidine kinase/CheY-like chemotaxis protein
LAKEATIDDLRREPVPEQALVPSRVRWLPLVVFVVLAVVAGSTAWVVRGTVQRQEDQLLKERAGEVAVVLQTAFSSFSSAFPVIAVVGGTGDQAAFTQATTSLVQPTTEVIGVAESRADALDVVATTNDQVAARGADVPPAIEPLLRRALTTPGLVTDVTGSGGDARLTIAAAVPGPRPLVAFSRTKVNPSTPTPSPPGSPFSELDIALYAADQPDDARLVLTTTDKVHDVDGPGSVDQRLVTVGADKWLLLTRSREPLVGSFATNLPWFVLAVGLLTAALVAVLIEILVRRRLYVLRLVDERTRELEVLQVAERDAREAAELANQSKSEFLSRMSHELRTPLNAVSGFAQLLQLGRLDETQHESVEQILKGANHLLDLINEVLDITRIESGSFALSPEPVLVSDIIGDVTDLMGSLATHQGIHLVGAAGGGCDIHVLADRQRVKQILLNLVSNAIKYNRTGGTVAISCHGQESDVLRIQVADTGFGIRDEHLSGLFTPFERLGAELTNIEGTGIGLPLSKRLAEAMGGTLDYETTPGRGSTFWVDLPIVEGPVERYVRLDSHRHGDQPTAPEPTMSKVVYVEDNLENLKLVERVLEQRNDIEIIAAMQGGLGLELVREHMPKLVLLDLHLPDTTGDKVLQQLRSDPDTAGIPVIILSADATPGQATRLLALGARAFLTKPLDIRALLAHIDEAVTDQRRDTNSLRAAE